MSRYSQNVPSQCCSRNLLTSSLRSMIETSGLFFTAIVFTPKTADAEPPQGRQSGRDVRHHTFQRAQEECSSIYRTFVSCRIRRNPIRPAIYTTTLFIRTKGARGSHPIPTYQSSYAPRLSPRVFRHATATKVVQEARQTVETRPPSLFDVAARAVCCFDQFGFHKDQSCKNSSASRS